MTLPAVVPVPAVAPLALRSPLAATEERLPVLLLAVIVVPAVVAAAVAALLLRENSSDACLQGWQHSAVSIQRTVSIAKQRSAATLLSVHEWLVQRRA
jgi:hypothetical protein